MNSIETILLENIDNPASLFVFPTDVAVSRWADHLLRLRGGGTIAMQKFTAWDTFKQNSIRSQVQDKTCIPSALKRMFSSSLIQENSALCESGKAPVFVSLIRPEWAGQAGSYVNWLTGILPQLGIWFRQAAGMPIAKIIDNPSLPAAKNFSGDDIDLFNLALRYSKFLKKHDLFEPAWETPPFSDTGKECFIFFPDSLTDFNEYRDLLEASSRVKIINPVVSEAEAQDRDVFYYTNSRSEIAEAVLYVKALHDNKKIPWDSISVSIPNDEYYDSYLFREFDNRNIPYSRQSGIPLTSYPAGKFFAAIAACASSDFSFASLAELLLNQRLPWKHASEIKELIDFGINNNCISSWTEEENGKKTRVNVWEDAFIHPYGGIKPETKEFFYNIKGHIKAICNAVSFSEIRKQYFIFREFFFDMDNCLGETDTILARCISELMSLVEVEKDYPGLHLSDPYSFFTAYLDEKSYLAQQKTSGVAILPYRTAAPAPFDCHIILGASQDALTAVFSPLPFLSNRQREKLGLFDEDASKTFIGLHQFNSALRCVFFCSEQNFSGYAIPHSSLHAAARPGQRFGDDPQHHDKFAPDLFRAETNFYSSLHYPAEEKTHLDHEMPRMIHKNQKQGFENWVARRKTAGEIEAKTALNIDSLSIDHPLVQMIQRRFCDTDNGKPGVSSSSLAPYFECTHKWVFSRVLELENIEIETRLMASNITGLVFHAVLNLFFDELKKTGALFSGFEKSYSVLLKRSIDTVFGSFPRLPNNPYQEMSMLTARLIKAQQELFYHNLENFIVSFISFFQGHRVIATETMHRLQKDFYYCKGKVDLILEDCRDNSTKEKPLAIIDFKTKNMPSLSDYTGENGLADFQLPMYLELAEAEYKRKVHTALFFSIIDAEPLVLFGSVKNEISGTSFPKKEKDFIIRGSETYNLIMEEFDEKTDEFAEEIKKGTFPVYPEYSVSCLNCDYNKICRTLYKICQGKKHGS